MLLDVSNLTFSYTAAAPTLREMSFQIEPGEIIGLVGPNGSGKSTLIQNIFDVLKCDSGNITVGGYPHTSLRAKQESIYLSSNDNLPEFLTGREYIKLHARLYGIVLNDDELESYFVRYAMRSRSRDLIEDYSHGMKKKLQLITAFILKRRLTVIDETLNGIDIEAMRFAEQDILSLRTESSSVVLCSHEFAYMQRLADRVIFLWGGDIVNFHTTEEITSVYGSVDAMVSEFLDELANIKHK